MLKHSAHILTDREIWFQQLMQWHICTLNRQQRALYCQFVFFRVFPFASASFRSWKEKSLKIISGERKLHGVALIGLAVHWQSHCTGSGRYSNYRWRRD